MGRCSRSALLVALTLVSACSLLLPAGPNDLVGDGDADSDVDGGEATDADADTDADGGADGDADGDTDVDGVVDGDSPRCPEGCDDLLPCTGDSCHDGVCRHEVLPGTCLIDGGCQEEGAIRVDNRCEGCDPELDPLGWSPREGEACNDGLACTIDDRCTDDAICRGTDSCEDDGLSCTLDYCAGTDECVHPLEDRHCLIDGACWDPGEENPDNSCQVCDGLMSAHAWWTRGDGAPCGEDGECSGGSCED